MTRSHLVNRRAHDAFKLLALSVIRRAIRVNPPIREKTLDGLLPAAPMRRIDADGQTSEAPDRPEARNVGLAVADIDDVAKGYGTLIIGNVIVDAFIVHIQASLVDAEQELGLRRVVDRDGGPIRHSVGVEVEPAGEDAVETTGYGCALYDLLVAGRDDVVPDVHLRPSGIVVDAIEPCIHTIPERHALALVAEYLSRDGFVCTTGFLQHQHHIDEDVVGMVPFAYRIYLAPENIR